MSETATSATATARSRASAYSSTLVDAKPKLKEQIVWFFFFCAMSLSIHCCYWIQVTRPRWWLHDPIVQSWLLHYPWIIASIFRGLNLTQLLGCPGTMLCWVNLLCWSRNLRMHQLHIDRQMLCIRVTTKCTLNIKQCIHIGMYIVQSLVFKRARALSKNLGLVLYTM